MGIDVGRRTAGWAAAFLWLLVIAASACAEDSAKGRLFFFGVAIDERPPTGKTVDHYNYAPDNFLRIFQTQSQPYFREIREKKILGKEATHQHVLAELRKIGEQVEPEDLVFVYWGTHGSTDESGWSASLVGGESFAGHELKRELRKFECPVVIAVSTCGSGGFAQAKSRSAGPIGVPMNVTAICACHQWESTNNELDVSLLEALAGFGDLDGNGEVTLGEALEYVPKRYRDWFGNGRGHAILPVLGQGENSPLDRPLTKVTADRALVAHQDRWFGASILERLPGGKLKVRYLGFDTTCTDGSFSMPNEVVAAESVFLPGGGLPLEVEWHGRWFPARLLEKTAEGARIHYVGYPSSDDETVARERIRVPYAAVARMVARGSE